jgi:hypothetical protein
MEVAVCASTSNAKLRAIENVRRTQRARSIIGSQNWKAHEVAGLVIIYSNDISAAELVRRRAVMPMQTKTWPTGPDDTYRREGAFRAGGYENRSSETQGRGNY